MSDSGDWSWSILPGYEARSAIDHGRIPIETTDIPLGGENLPSSPPSLVLVVLLIAGALLLWSLTDVALVVFSSILMAVAFRGPAEPISKFLEVPVTASVLIVVLLL